MGVESDRLVFDYLSRVGDLAQTALPAAQRMQLVARLRTDIDKRRVPSDNPAAVRRILGQIGTPDEVVEAAATGAGRPPYAEGPQVPAGGSGRRPAAAPGAYGPYGASGASATAGQGVPGPRAGAGAAGSFAAWDAAGPDWWRVDRRGGAPHAGDEIAGLPGMTGGVFIPFDSFDDDDDGGDGGDVKNTAAAAAGDGSDAAGAGESAEDGGTDGRRPPAAAALRRLGTGWGSPVLLLAAALLVAGAVTGSLIVLGLGWALGYMSRGLTRTQAKFAVLGLPACAAAGLVVWVWGRDTGHWGSPIAHGQLGAAFQHGYPVAVRLAALATALYLLRRARRS